MMRRAAPNDTSAIVHLAVASGLFPPDGTELVEGILAAHFAGNGQGEWVVVEADDEVCGVAYHTPIDIADGGHFVKMIAVAPDRQRQGIGARLMSHVEETLRGDGQRLLLVETSSLEGWDGARAFYAQIGYEEEARVRDYYAAGDDLVIFRKALVAS